MFAGRRKPMIVIQPQYVFYAGPDEDRSILRRGLTARDWKMLWISYCITCAIVIMTLYVCLASTDPIPHRRAGHDCRTMPAPPPHPSRSVPFRVVK